MVGSSLIQKKKISRNDHSMILVLPLVVTRYSTCCHSLLLAVTRCSTRCHSSSLVVTCCVTHCHSLSLVSLFIDNRLKVFLRDIISVRRSRLQIFFRIGVLKKLTKSLFDKVNPTQVLFSECVNILRHFKDAFGCCFSTLKHFV